MATQESRTNASIIKLNVGDTIFHTKRSTLEQSPWFQSFLSSRWETCTDWQEDGSLFIDRDAEAFKYLLNYMRHPHTYPLFWSKREDFDYGLYVKLAAEADFFLLNDLRGWIRKGKYRDAIRTHTTIRNIDL
ncbi:hypothetical protein BDV96DRAFT_640977 [Lophiotrema nucula]|uniref:BTB domain-containing protein n=1 Tax=Lophiotrema nucula TaxID=690887 RepID=A0A6A5ZRU9_9PLEO|nr:hypothetical protein BDV96DRAFT_640977 [Lophiotrema nucula]